MPPASTTNPNLLSTPLSLHTHLLTFLRAFTHQILYLRKIYPSEAFTPVRAYNCAIRQCRHPQVCDWINSAISAIGAQLRKNTVSTFSVAVFSADTNTVFEKFVVDLGELPLVPDWKRDAETEFEATEDEAEGSELTKKINLTDLEALFRSLFSKLNVQCTRMKALPTDEECTFTIMMEVKEDADRPVGRLDPGERVWIAAEDEDRSADASEDPRHPKSRTLAVRRVDVGELRMEVWVEEAKEKGSRAYYNDAGIESQSSM
ncbi:MAG: hypothetical protein Q9227_005824 [Pyrenula ochraceoflavens]